MRDGGTDGRKVARWWLVLPVLGLALAGAACSETGGPADALTVYVLDDYFSPARLTVPINSTVTYVWSGNNPHNVFYVAGPAPLPPNSGTSTSENFQTTFTRAGTYDYRCTLHAGMIGAVVVTP